MRLKDKLTEITLINIKDQKKGKELSLNREVFEMTRFEWFFKSNPNCKGIGFSEGIGCSKLLRHLADIGIEDDQTVSQILAETIDQLEKACLNAVFASTLNQITQLNVNPYG